MVKKYILGIDQSTQGTKALLFDDVGNLLCRSDIMHKQIVNDLGWVEHNPMEIYNNTIQVIKDLVEKSSIDKENIIGLGISNQRETAMVWDRVSGTPEYNAIVWQCSRGAKICEGIEADGFKDTVKEHTGLPLSPYFSAAKIAWVLQNVQGTKEKNDAGQLCCGTMDSWLIYKLTGGKHFKTDYSNASRTQLFHISDLKWDETICKLFGINTECLAKVCDSNSLFGETDLDGFLTTPIPINGVLGDSHGALFAQGCLKKGMIKTTYGTGSSIMMNIGEKPVFSKQGLASSLAWCMDGKVNYVLEGNINYTGAVISWLEKDLKIISSARETEELAVNANPLDRAYFVPAFTGLGAPYWDSNATGIISGMTRTTGQAEIVRAALDSIAYQIADIVKAMGEDSELHIEELRVDGGPTNNSYLMQFQSDILDIPVRVPSVEELSGIGAAFAAGIGLGIYQKEDLFANDKFKKSYTPQMEKEVRNEKYKGWKDAVKLVLSK